MWRALCCSHIGGGLAQAYNGDEDNEEDDWRPHLGPWKWCQSLCSPWLVVFGGACAVCLVVVCVVVVLPVWCVEMGVGQEARIRIC